MGTKYVFCTTVVAECFPPNEHAECGPRLLHVNSVIGGTLICLCDHNDVSLHILGYIFFIDYVFIFVDLVKLWPQIGPNWTSFRAFHPLLRAAIDVSPHHEHQELMSMVRYKDI